MLPGQTKKNKDLGISKRNLSRNNCLSCYAHSSLKIIFVGLRKRQIREKKCLTALKCSMLSLDWGFECVGFRHIEDNTTGRHGKFAYLLNFSFLHDNIAMGKCKCAKQTIKTNTKTKIRYSTAIRPNAIGCTPMWMPDVCKASCHDNAEGKPSKNSQMKPIHPWKGPRRSTDQFPQKKIASTTQVLHFFYTLRFWIGGSDYASLSLPFLKTQGKPLPGPGKSLTGQKRENAQKKQRNSSQKRQWTWKWQKKKNTRKNPMAYACDAGELMKPHPWQFQRVTIRGAQPSARLSKEQMGFLDASAEVLFEGSVSAVRAPQKEPENWCRAKIVERCRKYFLEEDKRATTNVQNRFALFFLLSFLLFCSPWAKTLCFEGESPGGTIMKKCQKLWKSVKNSETILPFSCCPSVFLWIFGHFFDDFCHARKCQSVEKYFWHF